MFDTFFFQFGAPEAFYVSIPMMLGAFFIRRFFYKPITYRYTLVDVFASRMESTKPWFLYLLDFLRYGVFALLFLLAAKPHIVDKTSQLPVEGIDIVLVLDVSGSMQYMDYDEQKKSRIDIAKEEAVRFVSSRVNDAIGLVIFGNDAMSRCPITSDKCMLKKLINELAIGIVDPEGTVLARSIITAANRLKQSQAKNKVMIVLTDGEPSDQDLDISVAIKVVKELEIKVYTVGIGSEKEEFLMHPFYGLVPKPKVNAELLSFIANQTSGQFFMARNAKDMRKVYDTIDQLEKTRHDVPVFGRSYDLLFPIGFTAFVCLMLYLILSIGVWFQL